MMDGSIKLLDGVGMTKQQLLLKAIELDPSNSLAYFNLANTLSNNDTIALSNGTKMTRQQLHRKAIELDPSNLLAHYNLAKALSD